MWGSYHYLQGNFIEVLVQKIAKYIKEHLPAKGNDMLLFLPELSKKVFRSTKRAEDFKRSILSYCGEHSLSQCNICEYSIYFFSLRLSLFENNLPLLLLQLMCYSFKDPKSFHGLGHVVVTCTCELRFHRFTRKHL